MLQYSIAFSYKTNELRSKSVFLKGVGIYILYIVIHTKNMYLRSLQNTEQNHGVQVVF